MEYNVIITKKRIKNIILKVKSDGTVTLSVPHRTPKKFIDEFLKSREEWILKHLSKIEKNMETNSYENNGSIFFLGEKYKLEIFPANLNEINFQDKILKIYTTKEISEKNVETIIYKWYKKMAEIYFKKSLEKYSSLTGEKFSEFKIRKMKSRWGSCRFEKKIITLNVELMKKSLQCIDYVCLHEVAHLRYPNHKKEFWDFVALFMPNWKSVKNYLNKNSMEE